MIKIFTSRLTPEGIKVSGEETSDFLELKNDDNIYSTNPVYYELVAQLVNNGILVTGRLHTIFVCYCAKCLTKYEFHVNCKEVCHFYENSNKNEINLTDDIREDILISLPQRFLCSDTCKGLCFHCGQNLNIEECSCTKIVKQENVWQKLDQLKFKD